MAELKERAPADKSEKIANGYDDDDDERAVPQEPVRIPLGSFMTELKNGRGRCGPVR